MKKRYQVTIVIVGAIALSTVATQASDLMRNIHGDLVGLAVQSKSVCGQGAVEVNLGNGPLCVDEYEASPSKACPHQQPKSQLDTQDNLNSTDCTAVSAQGVMPWTYVSLAQAQQLCARSGKRLPTAAEWYALASGQGDQQACVTDASAPALTGSAACVTATGVHDMIGNVWEWVNGQVTDGSYDNRTLPASGYVSVVDSNGVVVNTTSTAQADYGQDYATVDGHGVRGILRGGYYGSGSDAGIYAQNLAAPLNTRTPGIGFRCVASVNSA